jgi:glycosyltransferase involved in cell wall biosynthesis
MLIGIDASRATVAQRTGTEGYSLHIIRGLIAQGEEYCFRLYFREEPEPGLVPDQDNVECEVIRRRRLWTHTGLRKSLQRNPPDVLFVPAHTLPWPTAGGVPSVVTAHDLGYLHYPDKHPLLARLYLDWSTRHSASIARRIIAVSQATAQDLVALNGIPRDKIRVVHSGVDEKLMPVRDEVVLRDMKKRLGIKGPYVLHVGSIQPRKNLTRLVEAFAQIMDIVVGLRLVLVGRKAWGDQSLIDRINDLDLSERVVLPGYVPDDDLAALYSGASVYAFPSLYEGFGFPALEAMACGTPVVCANTSSLPEIVGDAALTFAPTDVDGQADALRRVLTDPALSKRLVERGFARIQQFTWESAARATLAVICEAASIAQAAT